jgi:hypothetical protein
MVFLALSHRVISTHVYRITYWLADTGIPFTVILALIRSIFNKRISIKLPYPWFTPCFTVDWRVRSTLTALADTATREIKQVNTLSRCIAGAAENC